MALDHGDTVSDSWLVCALHANTRRLHDPKLMLGPLGRQDGKDPGHEVEHLPSAGFGWSKHDDADILAWRIGPDVGEVQVEREEHACLGPAHCSDLGIFCSCKSFVVNGVATPSGGTHKLGGLNGHVFIELRAHA